MTVKEGAVTGRALAVCRQVVAGHQRVDDRQCRPDGLSEQAAAPAEPERTARQREAQEALARAEREALERQAAELRAQQEAARRQQEANDAEARRLELARAEAERKAEEEKAKAEREAAAKAEAERVAKQAAERRKERESVTPDASDIVDLVADHYDVSPQAAERWLSDLFGLKQAA